MPEDEKNDPLDRLFVKERDLSDRKLLADTLLPFATIYVLDTERFEVSLTDQGQQLPSWKKLLVYFLAHKAIAIRAAKGDEKEGLTPKQLEEETEIPGGTIRPTLKKLSDEGLVRQDTAGAYFVPNRIVRRIRDLLIEGLQQP